MGNTDPTDYHNIFGDIGITAGARARKERRNQQKFAIEQFARESTFNAKQSQLNRDFQERLSSTAVQRRFKDMAAAGVNPMFAGEMGASTPAGGAASASAKGSNQAPVSKSNILGTILNAALGIGKVVSSTALGISKLNHSKSVFNHAKRMD